MASDSHQDFRGVPDQAAYWVVLLHTRGDINPILPLFCKWLQAAPDHRPEYLRFEAAWRVLEELRNRGLLDSHRLSNASMPLPTRPLLRPYPWRRPVMVATTAVLIIAGGLRLGAGLLVTRDCGDAQTAHAALWCQLSQGQHAADAGQPQTLYLSDGSVIRLGSNSNVTLDLTDNYRGVVLDYGEALFQVAQKPSAPFVVTVGDTTVRALGTAFSVKREGPDSVKTLVVEGSIEIRTDRQQTSRAVEGQAAEVHHGETELSWAVGGVSFRGETLAQAVQKLNSANRCKLAVDAEIGVVPLGGWFSTSPTKFANELHLMLGIEHTLGRDPKTGEKIIHLHPKKTASPLPRTGDREHFDPRQSLEE